MAAWAAIFSAILSSITAFLGIFLVPDRQASADNRTTLASERRQAYTEFLGLTNARLRVAEEYGQTLANAMDLIYEVDTLPTEDQNEAFAERAQVLLDAIDDVDRSELLATYNASLARVRLLTSSEKVAVAADNLVMATDSFEIRVSLENRNTELVDPESDRTSMDALIDVRRAESEFIYRARAEQGMAVSLGPSALTPVLLLGPSLALLGYAFWLLSQGRRRARGIEVAAEGSAEETASTE